MSMFGRILISLTSWVFLFLSSFGLFLLLLVFELAVIDDLADRRVWRSAKLLQGQDQPLTRLQALRQLAFHLVFPRFIN
jgi:hypothetical protein